MHSMIDIQKDCMWRHFHAFISMTYLESMGYPLGVIWEGGDVPTMAPGPADQLKPIAVLFFVAKLLPGTAHALLQRSLEEKRDGLWDHLFDQDVHHLPVTLLTSSQGRIIRLHVP